MLIDGTAFLGLLYRRGALSDCVLAEQCAQPLDGLWAAERQQPVAVLDFEGWVGAWRHRARALDCHDVGAGMCAHVQIGE
jgi:hypothetical protein